MALAIVVTAGHTFPNGVPVTLRALRKAALPSVSISGSVGTGDIAAGAITAALVRPDSYWYAAGTFVAGTYSVTLSPALVSLTAGVIVAFKADSDNTGATQLNVNSLGAVAIKRNSNGALEAGDIRSGQIVECRYDGTYWQMLSQLGSVPLLYQGTDSGASDAYVVALNPVPANLAALTGKTVRFKAANNNFGASTIDVNGFGPVAIKRNANEDLQLRDIKQNQMVDLVYDGGWFQMQSQVGTEPQDVAIISDVRDLNVHPNASFPNSMLIYTFTELVVKDGNGNPWLVSETSLVVVNIATSGAGGLDTGVEANDTWYYIWIIYNRVSDIVSALLSVSSTSPTMPSGYDFKALVGVVRNDSSGNFVPFQQFGRKIWIPDTNVFTAKAGSVTYVLESITSLVPPNAKTISGSFGCSSQTAAPSGIGIAGNDSGLGAQLFSTATATGGTFSNFLAVAPFVDIPLVQTTQGFYWKASNTNANYRVNLSAYTI